MACTFQEDRQPDYNLSRAAIECPRDTKCVLHFARGDMRACPLGISEQFPQKFDSRAWEIFWEVYGGDEDAVFDAITTVSNASPEVKALTLQIIQLIKQAEPEEMAVICNLIDYLKRC